MRGTRPLVAAMLCVGVVLAAAGMSGFLTFPDHCSIPAYPEGTFESSGTELWPPGATCTYHAPIGTDADGRFLYADDATAVRAHGSAPVFFAVIIVAIGLAAMVVRRWPGVPRALRLTTATALAFSVFGVGALVGGVASGLAFGCVLGPPLAWAADRRMQRPGPGIGAGVTSAAVALTAVLGAVALLSLDTDLGAGAFGVALLGVFLTSSVRWPRPWVSREAA